MYEWEEESLIYSDVKDSYDFTFNGESYSMDFDFRAYKEAPDYNNHCEVTDLEVYECVMYKLSDSGDYLEVEMTQELKDKAESIMKEVADESETNFEGSYERYWG